MLGYQLRFRKGSFEFCEHFVSRSAALMRGAVLLEDAAVYDLSVFAGNGRLVATEPEIAWLCDKAKPVRRSASPR
jgi:hypothetical protein